MRIAVVMPHGVEPATGGDQIRAVQLCRQLAALGADVHLVHHDFSGGEAGPPDIASVPVDSRPRGTVRWLAWRAGLAARQHRDPFSLFSGRTAVTGLRAALRQLSPDVVDFQHSYLWVPTGLPDVVTFHNVESRLTTTAKHRHVPLRAVETREQQVITQAAQTVTLSEDDRARLLSLGVEPRRPPLCVPLGAPPPAPYPHPLRDRVTTLAFVGSFGYRPNVEAVDILFGLWPRLQRTGGIERLAVIGRGASRFTRPPPGVEIRSDVADVGSALADVDGLIVPLRSGGGVRVKIIEAFGMGLPVVSTRLGIEGLAAVDGTHAVIADDVDGLIAAVDRLAPLDFRRSLTIEARRLWERSFDPELMGRRMMDVYESVVAVSGRHG